MTILKKIGSQIFNSKALIVVTLFASLLLVPSIFAEQKVQPRPDADEHQEILGIASENTPPTPTVTPSPITVSTPTVTPTPSPTLIPSWTPIPVPTNNSTPSSTNTPTPTPTPTPILTPTPTPSPAGLNVQIGIDYAGQKPVDSYSIVVDPGQTAWEAVASAVGISNLQYTDYGGDLGIFITGFNGISAASNQFYEFKVNGVSSSVGVSAYECKDGDVLDFVLTTF